jgi:hypothetical protein
VAVPNTWWLSALLNGRMKYREGMLPGLSTWSQGIGTSGVPNTKSNNHNPGTSTDDLLTVHPWFRWGRPRKLEKSHDAMVFVHGVEAVMYMYNGVNMFYEFYLHETCWMNKAT